jgi:5'-nucleotidase (lipoprotein e(P4) family)
MRSALLLLTAAAWMACAPPAAVVAAKGPAAGEAAAAASAPYPRDLLWVRTSAEHQALFVQTFKAARDRLTELAHRRDAGTWAVIIDADETLIDNSEYQRRLHSRGATFDSLSWDVWVRERAATALPGAVEYVKAVRDLGGRVVVVTNREDDVCDPTRSNLEALGMAVDLVLCRRGVSDKNPRFESVAAGTAGGGLPPLEVIQWVGDNIQDFPRMTQRVREEGPSALAPFGDRYFILPNPMYGSFERNPPR